MSNFNKTIQMAEFESFNDKVMETYNKTPGTIKKAYEKTETQHKKEFGRRRYGSYSSYKRARYYHHYKNRKK